jgi:acetyl esterase/lipase
MDVTRRLTALVVITITALASSSLSGQQPLTFDSVAKLPAPTPTHRVAYGADPLQFGHLRLPRGAGRHPVVVFVHGGCYLRQYTISHVGALEQALADSGYAVWSIEYRRVGDEGGGWPGTFEDVGRAADHLRVLAEQHSLDLTRVVAAGHSAGANFALWLAARSRIRAESPLRVEKPLSIHGVLGLAPAPDLAALHARGVCNNVIDKLMGGAPDSVAERYRDVSPATLLPIGVPQVLLVGEQDRSWGPAGLSYHALALAARDTLARRVDAPGAGHFDVIAPTSPTWRLVMEALRSLTPR